MATENYLSKVQRLRQATRERMQRKNSIEAMPPEQQAEVSKLRRVLNKLRGRDRLGLAGETVTVAGSAAAGVAVAGTVASAAGATTLLGSTTLAGMLGGIFVTTTPVGWVVGSAVVAGAIGFGAVKLMRSGGKQDQLRAEMSGKLSARLAALEQNSSNGDAGELGRLLSERVESGAITPEAAKQVSTLVEQGRLNPELALQRIRALPVERPGV